VDEPRPPEEAPPPADDVAYEADDADDEELEEPMPPIGTAEPLGVIELLREEIGSRFGRLFRRG
jgi:hypothetical protein